MDEVKKTIETYNKIADYYCPKTRQEKFLKWEEDFIKRQLDYIGKKKALILDIGCGDGRHCKLFEKNGARAIGIDLSDSMIEQARRYYPEGDFRKMDMRHLAFTENHFDGIWSSGSIYHVTKNEIGTVFKGFGGVLKDKGIFALSFKLGSGEGMEANPKSYGGSPRYFAYYSREEMLMIAEGFGFEEIDSCLYPEEIFGDNLQQMWFRLNK